MSHHPTRAKNSVPNDIGAVSEEIIEPAGGTCAPPPVSVSALFFGPVGKFPIAVVLFYLRWLREELVNALVRPVFARVIAAHRWGGLPAQVRFGQRFEQLVDALDCWPCRIDWDWSTGSLAIYSGPFDDDIFDLPEGAHFA